MLGFEQALAADNLRFGATYFHNNIKNLIDDNADFTSYIEHRPRGDGRRRELRRLSAAADARPCGWTTPTLQATDEIVHQELLRRPKHKGELECRVASHAADCR